MHRKPKFGASRSACQTEQVLTSSVPGIQRIRSITLCPACKRVKCKPAGGAHIASVRNLTARVHTRTRAQQLFTGARITNDSSPDAAVNSYPQSCTRAQRRKTPPRVGRLVEAPGASPLDKSVENGGMSNLRTLPSGFAISTRLTGVHRSPAEARSDASAVLLQVIRM